MADKKIKVGVVGLGGRGSNLTQAILCLFDDIKIEYVCDLYEDRTEKVADAVNSKLGYRPKTTLDYHDIINDESIDAVMVYAAWEAHIPVAIAAMKAGKYVAMEVGGAYSVKDCWDLVATSEETGMPCMMLENCCYGKHELMVHNMVRQGLFGEIVYCEGGYRHDLRDEITRGEEKRHYRLRNYKTRNCDNYPTHALGPIAKILDINRGNRMLSLCSVATKAVGLHDYIEKKFPDNEKLMKTRFAQGDVVTTLIRCARGEVIRLTLDTCLPRYYTRDFSVQGTGGYYSEQAQALYLDGEPESWDVNKILFSAKNYEDKYLSPTWQQYKVTPPTGGHGGMDYLVHKAFLDCVREGSKDLPIDVYDTASWMVITALSEASVANGGAFVEIPDFTRGAWSTRPIRDVEDFKLN
ncbi:MAG: gfo/Idh/MocA family oxidoreductase [Ruminococcaceae bacterium]|nr:gfo/Idh/MocA family oxidoreductase [Oscillospiraceae bacterium]